MLPITHSYCSMKLRLLIPKFQSNPHHDTRHAQPYIYATPHCACNAFICYSSIIKHHFKHLFPFGCLHRPGHPCLVHHALPVTVRLLSAIVNHCVLCANPKRASVCQHPPLCPTLSDPLTACRLTLATSISIIFSFWI